MASRMKNAATQNSGLRCRRCHAGRFGGRKPPPWDAAGFMRGTMDHVACDKSQDSGRNHPTSRQARDTQASSVGASLGTPGFLVGRVNGRPKGRPYIRSLCLRASVRGQKREKKNFFPKEDAQVGTQPKSAQTPGWSFPPQEAGSESAMVCEKVQTCPPRSSAVYWRSP